MSLLRILLSKRVLHSTCPTLVHKISITIAHLLSFEVSLQRTIMTDLFNLCFDLSVVQEANLFEFNTTVRMLLFTETASDDRSDYFLEIPSADAVYTLQVSAMTIVLEFSSQRRSKRMDAAKACCYPDAMFYSWRRDEESVVPTLLACVRQILLSPLLPKTSVRTLDFSLRARVGALKLMNALVMEWHQFEPTEHLKEAVLVLVATIRWYFVVFDHLGENRNCLVGLLKDLWQDAVLFSPTIGVRGNEEKQPLGSLILPDLIECIADMYVVLRKGTLAEIALCELLLQTVCVVITNESRLVEMAVCHCTTRAIFPKLFALLGDSNVGIRISTLKIIQTFLQSRSRPPAFLATACRFAVTALGQGEAESTRNPLENVIPDLTSQVSPKRKAVVLAPSKLQSLRKVDFERSPKRARSGMKSTCPPQGDFPETAYLSLPVSLLDSCTIFLSKTLQCAKQIQIRCQQGPCVFHPGVDNSDQLLYELADCCSASFLLLPLLRCDVLSEGPKWIYRAIALLLDALAEMSEVLDSAYRGLHQNPIPSTERLAKFVELIVDFGLVLHSTFPESTSKGPRTFDGRVSRFWAMSSRCAWNAMAWFSTVASPISEVACPWRYLCHQCSFIMRFLDIQEARYRPCRCTLEHSIVPALIDMAVDNRFDFEKSLMPASIKLIIYSFSRPYCAKLDVLVSTEPPDIHDISKKVWQEGEGISQALLTTANTSSSLFSVAFLAMLPSLVIPLTRAIIRGVNGREFDGEVPSQSLNDVYWMVCASFPYETLSVILKQKKLLPRLKIGAMIGIQSYRSLLHPTSDWTTHNLTGYSFALPYFPGEEVHHEDCSLHQEISSIDRSLRLTLLSMASDFDDQLSSSDRLRKWRAIKETVLHTPAAELRSVLCGSSDSILIKHSPNIPAVLGKMLSVPFADKDYHVRLSASRELGEFLLQHNGRGLLSTFTNGGDGVSGEKSIDKDTLVGGVVAYLFQEIDRLLFHHSCIPRSQLLSNFANISPSKEPRQRVEMLAEYQHTALRTLASLCESANRNDRHEMVIFKHALLLLVRFWAVFDCGTEENEIDSSVARISSLSFFEMRRLSVKCDFTHLSSTKSLQTFIPALFSEVLSPASCSLASQEGGNEFGCHLRQRQNSLLFSFLESFVLSSLDGESIRGDNEKLGPLAGSVSTCAVTNFIDESLRFAVPSMVIDKDYDAIRLATGFKLFALGIHMNSSNDLGDFLIGTTIQNFTSRALGATKGPHGLDEQTKLLCLQPKMTQHVVPRLLISNTHRSQLVFFLHVVLQRKITFKELITSSDKAILREIIWELGGSSHIDQQSVQSLKLAALARDSAERGLEGEDIGGSDVQKTHAHAIASKWVSSHFMFLLVNIVQLKWHEKTLDDQARAIRSLNLMLKFLLPSEAPRFLTQLLATVSIAMSQDPTAGDSEHNGAKIWLLRSLAARTLATYVDMLVQDELQLIGRNLATIVVTLFPVLVLPANRLKAGTDEFRLRTEAGEIAAGILEDFTSGKAGEELSKYFKEIPFLPSTPLLDKVKDNLKRYGVDFDRFLVLTCTQTVQRVSSAKEHFPSDAVGTEIDCGLPHSNENLLTALQTRLRVLRPLLSQESASVRLATLQHLIDLLRANRSLFYRLIEREDPSTTSVLTVTYSTNYNHESRGAVTALVEALLSRASVENSRKIRSALGACLGEVAAIDPHRLGTVSPVPRGTEQKWPTTPSMDSRSWQLSHPPWQSSIKEYALRLLTKLLVNALKAASNSAEQHKVAHTIQQLLALLDKQKKLEVSESDDYETIDMMTPEAVQLPPRCKGNMSNWLREALKAEGVVNILEPYWGSSFSENMSSGNKKLPPFYKTAENYFQWMSRLCRFMIMRSQESSKCPSWRSLFFACRTVVRSLAGTEVSEFILPILVLERLCYGSRLDVDVIQQELLDIFQIAAMPIFTHSTTPLLMPFSERQKAVNVAFLLVDTLQLWKNREIEGLFKKSTKQDLLKGSKFPTSLSSGVWDTDLALEKIDDLVDALPLETMAKAAAAMGMHARALLSLEAKARIGLVSSVFDSSEALGVSSDAPETPITLHRGFGSHLLRGVDLSLLKEVLGNLDDYPTMKAVAVKTCAVQYDKDDIREKESRRDWAGALNDYERALQKESDVATRTILEQASLRCLLEMGQYESVLNQANGIMYKAKKAKSDVLPCGARHAIPLAIDAAWRLGRWSTLDCLLDEYGPSVGSEISLGDCQLAIGKAMSGLYRRSKSQVDDALSVAKETLMSDLSTVARDGYERAYPTLVRLQCIREIEDANLVFNEEPFRATTKSNILSDLAASRDLGGWAWDLRLDVVSKVDYAIITDVRLALARLAGDTKLERDVFFTMGKKARKNGLLDVASTCFAQSRIVSAVSMLNGDPPDTTTEWIGDLQMQLAKLEYQAGKTSCALRILGVEDVKGWSNLSEADLLRESAARLQIITGNQTAGSDQSVRYDMAKRLLKSTRWIADGGLKSVPEVLERFRVSNRLRPKWAKCHFEFGKYLDSLLEARITGVAQHEGWFADDDNIRQYALSEDMNCQNYLLMAMEQYLDALKFSDMHVYQALPRVLSLWFEYTSIERRMSRRGKTKQSEGDTPVNLSPDPNAFLRNQQDKANQLFQEAASRIPSSMFYTATPQLISRVCHPNSHTALAVQTLLTRVLSKFPGQAMWVLAWVRNSLDKTRSSLGNEIFHSAQKSISGWASNDKKVDLRRKQFFEKNRNILVASKSYVTYLIDIAKYLPKDERSRSFKLSKWRGEVELCDFIPPVQTALSIPLDTTKGRDPFPRFRAVHSGVQIMSSKAKPKRVKFYVVPTASGMLVSPGVASGPSPEDIGELHFLVKNEAKGDLRKDARVQDLNNVINRLLTSAGQRTRQRRLRLRTFSVTCLSEDSGIVEWVPNTESFRSLASKSYNPQAATYSVKRRGKRMANFGDPSLKINFEACQNYFFKNGDLTTAARLFEQHFLKAFPPLLYWWFAHSFMDPHGWYEARTNFTTSAAVWSAVGHVIGLGDRHSENLLIDTFTGGCVHVDFDW